jgi:Mn-dependent DtxR family transcriptional regulator
LDRVDAILWEVYYNKGITTKRDLAEHFNIDPSSALIYINELKAKFRNYVEDKERI